MLTETEEPVCGTAWRDGKRYAWLLGLVVPLLPFIGAGAVRMTGAGIFWWFGPFFLFVLAPLLDALVGGDTSNPPDSTIAALEKDPFYRWCTYLYLPLQYAALIWACAIWTRSSLRPVEALGLAITIGIVGGTAINTAHELGHKSEKTERWLAKIALAQTGYGHFYVEHNRGHHVRVATPEDPASSRLGESFWAFLPRTVIGSVASAWRIERQRLQRKGKMAYSFENEVLHAWAMSLLLYGALLAAFGVAILPLLLVQAIVGFSLLEVVNYLEHYGLARRKMADGRYEPCAPRHSWNSNNTVSNLLLYHLQRHSDHHVYPSRRYQALRSCDGAPELPSGYGAMIVIAPITPIWRRIMDPKVLAHYHGDASLANVQPSKRAKYGVSG